MTRHAAEPVHASAGSSPAARAACSCCPTATCSSAGAKCRACPSSTAPGGCVFDAMLGKDYECYRAFRLPWTGRPRRGARARAGRHRTRPDRVRELERRDRGAQLAAARGRPARMHLQRRGSTRATRLRERPARQPAGPASPREALDARGQRARTVARGDARQLTLSARSCVSRARARRRSRSVAASPEMSSVVTIDSRHLCEVVADLLARADQRQLFDQRASGSSRPPRPCCRSGTAPGFRRPRCS